MQEFLQNSARRTDTVVPHWHAPFTDVLDWSDAPVTKWFVNGQLNIAYNCVDRHVLAGHGDRVAIYLPMTAKPTGPATPSRAGTSPATEPSTTRTGPCGCSAGSTTS